MNYEDSRCLVEAMRPMIIFNQEFITQPIKYELNVQKVSK
jgi:hypothetical protein